MLIHLLIVIIVIAVLVWLIGYIPIPQQFRWLLYVVVLIIALVVLLPFLGVHV